MSSITGKPVLVDKLDPELAAKVVKLVVEDNERAKRAREQRKQRNRRKRTAAKS